MADNTYERDFGMDLFIIGNGFDRAHNLPTAAYKDFRNYLEQDNWQYLSNLESQYGYYPLEDDDPYILGSEKYIESVEDGLWRDFETNLANIDDTSKIDFAVSMDLGLETGNIGIIDTMNVYWEQEYGFITKLCQKLYEWVFQIELDTHPVTKMFENNTEALFFTFNYTRVLEEIHGIEKHRIIHVHGCVDTDVVEKLVIGHGNKAKITELEMEANKAEKEFDEKKTSICNALATYCERTFKDVNTIIWHNENYFEKLHDIDQVYIVGHSFGDVDIPYFAKIRSNIKPTAIWNVYYYNPSNELEYKNKLIAIGVPAASIITHYSSEFFS